MIKAALVIPFLLLLGCAKVYINPDFYNISCNNPKIAIIPFTSTDGTVAFQEPLYAMLNNKSKKSPFYIQPINETNAKLIALGKYDKMSTKALAESLNVDAIITGSAELFNPNQDVATPVKVVASIYSIFNTSFNMGRKSATSSIKIYSRQSAELLLWSYKRREEGSALANMNTLLVRLIMDVYNKIPYGKCVN